MKRIFTIEGNIGSGKSTIIQRLKEKYTNLIYLPEPVDEWNKIRDYDGVTILEKFYKDKKRYSFSFQMMAYITRLSQLRRTLDISPEGSIIITERCLDTDRYIFAQMLYDSGFIEDIEFNIYLSWFNEFNKFYYGGIIYIKVDPEICFERIKMRNRKGEDSIPLEYLNDCHKYHENWINKIKLVNVYTFDGTSEIDIEDIHKVIIC